MKKLICLGFSLFCLFLITNQVQATSSYSHVITLEPGWNLVSPTRLLESHEFSASSTSANYDIYVLNPNSISQWSTMAEIGHTEFQPLFGYFINNKTGTTTTLTFNYIQDVAPNNRFFSRTILPGWNSVGIANPSYALKQKDSDITDTNNVKSILDSIGQNTQSVYDLTANQTPKYTTGISDVWNAFIYNDANNLDDFRETKAYVTYNTSTGTYNGFQNNDPIEVINLGSISITPDPTFVTSEIIEHASNVTLAKFNMQAHGEDMQVNSLDVVVTMADATTTEGINQLTLFVNGSQVGSSQTYLASELTTPQTFGVNNLFTIPAGTTVSVEVRGTLNQLSESCLTEVRTDIYLQANRAQGIISNTTYPILEAIFGIGNQLTVIPRSLTVAKNVNFQDQNVIKNQSAAKIGSYVLQTSSAEGARITNINIALSGSTTPQIDLANLYISESTNPVQPQASNNFPVNFTIPVNSSKVIDVYADLGDIANDKTIITTITVTALGLTTNQSVGGMAAGQTITINSSTMSSVTSVANNPSAGLVLGGETKLAGTYKFVAANGSVVITEMTVNVTTNDVATSSNAISSLTIGGITVPVVNNGTSSTATFTGLNLVVPAGLSGLQVFHL